MSEPFFLKLADGTREMRELVIDLEKLGAGLHAFVAYHPKVNELYLLLVKTIHKEEQDDRDRGGQGGDVEGTPPERPSVQ